MQKYFQDPKSTEITSLLELMENLNSYVEKYIDVEMARLEDCDRETFKEHLSRCQLQYKSKDLKCVMKEISDLFKMAVRWNHPGTMINITPPPNLASIATSAYAMLFNPNFAIDTSSGYLVMAELEVIKYLAELAGWDWKTAHGIFTFGGTATNMYAIKIGLQKCCKDISDIGLKKNVFIATTEQGHPCHISACDWLGVGRNNCLVLPVKKDGRLNIEESEKIISKHIEEGNIFAGIIINGGTTLQMTVDPIKEIAQMRERLVKIHCLDYSPHIHVDSVIGWAWLFFKEYDFERNTLALEGTVLSKVKSMYNRISQIKYADSFGADFHKTGFCPYLSSVFICKDRSQIYELGREKALDLDELGYGNYSPYSYTMELTRPSQGPISALTAIKSFGIEGYQKLISGLVSIGESTKALLGGNPEFEVLSGETEGFATIFIIRQSKQDYLYEDILTMDRESAQIICDYNKKFYLYLLEKQKKRECTFSIDYSADYDTAINGLKIGVLKVYPMSPFLDKENLKEIISEMFELKGEYDRYFENFIPYDIPNKPKSVLCVR